MLAKSPDEIDTSSPLSAFKTLFTISFYISKLIFLSFIKHMKVMGSPSMILK